ncbi:MAG TPA: ThiF family adenylyltransferase [Bdellovibrionota bacterium]|nr:ThiF family adenylyltransferase [Bdellovibrionota bacterium]
MSRNRHFVPEATQRSLRRLNMLVAGCGSTGGACTQSLVRLGLERFKLADNGSYELTNLNRQHAFIENIGQNKAEFHASKMRQINPFIEVESHPGGISPENVSALVEWADLIMDAVDVTSPEGMKMKLLLHETAHARRKPVLTALDLGFCQWGRSYDYRSGKLAPLGGALETARRAKHPLKALFSIVPLSAVPAHSLQLIEDLMKHPERPASQMGGTSDLLAGIIGPTLIRFAATGELVPGWNINLENLALPLSTRLKLLFQAPRLRAEVARLMRKAD